MAKEKGEPNRPQQQRQKNNCQKIRDLSEIDIVREHKFAKYKKSVESLEKKFEHFPDLVLGNLETILLVNLVVKKPNALLQFTSCYILL